jgi:starch phosphorylase
LFSLAAEEVQATWRNGYDPHKIYHDNEALKAVNDLIRNGNFSHGDRELFRPLVDSLLKVDPY